MSQDAGSRGSSVVLTELRARRGRILDDVARLVSVESPSSDRAAIGRCAEVVDQLAVDTLGARAERIDAGSHLHLRWQWGTPHVLLLGHFDTVWPLGTLQRWPFSADGAIATGPGIFDMKAGVVGGLHALSLLDDLDGVAMLLTSDEELGSPTSRELIESSAQGLDAVLVLEPSAGGALKVARKGVSLYEVIVEGRAAHAGLEPEAGVNALEELSHQILALARIARPHTGTSVTPTVADGGTATNVVPATARLIVDVRVSTGAEQARVHEEMLALGPVVRGARISVSGGPNRPPLQEEAAADLFARATSLAADLGISPPGAARVGGGSDGNLTAALGVPTLDGLGAVGDGAHAEGEHVVIEAIAERAALVHGLVTDVLAGRSGRHIGVSPRTPS